MTNTKTNSFNPVKEDKDGVIARRMVWSSESLRLAIKGLEDGRKLVANPFYENNIKLLKGDLVFQRTEEEKDYMEQQQEKGCQCQQERCCYCKKSR